jgi:hypothetical protein
MSYWLNGRSDDTDLPHDDDGTTHDIFIISGISIDLWLFITNIIHFPLMTISIQSSSRWMRIKFFSPATLML